MDKYCGENIKILDLTGTGGLDTVPHQTIEYYKNYIDDLNKRRISEGWIKETQSYVIAREVWENIRDDNGLFVSESHTVERIEVYPPLKA